MTQNKSIQNIQSSLQTNMSSTTTNQNSTLTIIKAHNYETSRQKTPKIQVTKAQSSSTARLIRVSSSKGINVVSVRAGSTQKQKQVRQFNTNCNNSNTNISPNPNMNTDGDINSNNCTSLTGKTLANASSKLDQGCGDNRYVNTNRFVSTGYYSTNASNYDNNSNNYSKDHTISSNNYQYIYSGTNLPQTNSSTSITDNNNMKNYVATTANSTNSNTVIAGTTGYNTIQSYPTTTITYTTIRTQMEQELRKIEQKYQQKMNKEISYQYDYLTNQANKLREQLQQNQKRLVTQQQQYQELFKRVETIDYKIQNKANNMAKQLSEFQRFYEQCYKYTVQRINQAQDNMKSMTKYIQENTSSKSMVQSWQYVQYVNGLLKSIVRNTSQHTSELKYYLDQEIYELQLKICNFTNDYQQIDHIVQDMKSISFGNQTLKDYIKQMNKLVNNPNHGVTMNNTVKNSGASIQHNLTQFYEPKFKQLTKRINNSMIEIDLLRSLITSQSQKHITKSSQRINQLTACIHNLEQKMKQQKSAYLVKLAEKQQILTRSNPRILELQSKLHAYYEQEVQLTKQISQLRLKVAFYQAKCQKQKFSERQFHIQSTLAQAFSESIIKQKIKVYIQQKSELEQHIKQLQTKITKLDRQNYLLAEKLSNNQYQIYRQENIKLQAQLKFIQKINQNHVTNEKILQDQLRKSQQDKIQYETSVKILRDRIQRSEVESQLLKKQYDEIIGIQQQKHRQEKQKIKTQLSQLKSQYSLVQKKWMQSTQTIQKLAENNWQLKARIQSLQVELTNAKNNESRLASILSQQKMTKQDDELYFQQLQQQVQKSYKQIQQLKSINEELITKNSQYLEKNRELLQKNRQYADKNQQLQNDLIEYAQTFQKQSITFRNALANLSKQKQHIATQYSRLSDENKSLKLDLDREKEISSRTALSFYQNNSGISLQLRKTMSTDLGDGYGAGYSNIVTCGSTSKIAGTPKKLQRKGYSSINLHSQIEIPSNSHDDYRVVQQQGIKKANKLTSSINSKKQQFIQIPAKSDRVLKLKNILQKLRYNLPVVCEIDATGYLKDQKTGCYFVDENENYFELGSQQISMAIRSGYILL